MRHPNQASFIIAFAAYLSTQAQAQDPAISPLDACEWTSALLTELREQPTARHDDAELIALSVQYGRGDWTPQVLSRFHLRFSLLLHRGALVQPETAEVLETLLLPRFRALGFTHLSALTLDVIKALQPPTASGGSMLYGYRPGPLFDLHP